MRRTLPAVRSAVAVVLATLLALLVLPAPAGAATPGITSSVLLNGATYNGTDVVNEGDELTLRVQYNTDVTPGSTVVFDLDNNVTVTGVPAANTALESVTQNGNQVSITFQDPWPAGVNQGVFDLRFTVNDVDRSDHDQITWRIDGAERSINIIVRDSGDEFADVSEFYGKGVSPGNLDSFVTVVDGVVTLNPTILDQELNYTLQLDSPDARNDFTITDQLPPGLDYVPDSFGGQLTTWDVDGLNRSTSPFSFSPVVTGNAFTAQVSVPGPSLLALSYRARVTDVEAIEEIEALLQDQFDDLTNGHGQFQTFLTNTATFGGAANTREASVRLRHTVANPNPGPNLGQAFAKTADWSTKNVVTDGEGNLTPPADITYTLRADLRGWDGTNPNRVLSQNVIIDDTLPEQASWNTAAADFITADGIILTPVTTPPSDAEEFAGDAFAGQYWVNGQRLLINVGKNSTTNASIAVKAQLNTVEGLTVAGNTSIVDATPYRLRNVASFDYRDGDPHHVTRDVTVVELPSSTDGINDSSVFTKSGSARDSTIDQGESVTIDYRFDVAAGTGIDVLNSKIVDYVDADVFDLSDLSDVEVTGSYDGQPLNASHFDLSIDTDGNLVVELSVGGKAFVALLGPDRHYRVDISLTSKPFEGKVTKTITNKATLFGQDDDPLYWSETETEATSYGDEAEVRKRIWDRTAEAWAESVDARMDGSGRLVQDTYVYRIEFIPHGSYNHVEIIPVVDLLPDAVEFLGFVDEADVATGENPTAGPVEIGGNLVASYDAGSGSVIIAQKDGTVLDSTAAIPTYVAVQVTDASAPIVNRIGDTFAEIVPLPSVSVGDFVWVDTDRDGRQGDIALEPGIPGVVLELVGPDGGPVIDVFGEPVAPTTTGPNGEYTFDHLPALTGDETYTVRIDREASEEALRPYVPTKAGEGDREFDSSTWEASTVPGDLHADGDRDPTLDFGFVAKTYAIGDYVWIDANNNGIQDAGERPLAGVTVELLGLDGLVIDTTRTDERGRYVFDDLPAGTYQIRFTLTDEQKRIYEFTTRDSGPNDARDSDANPADGLTVTVVLDDSNEALTGEYEYRQISASQGIDPTWDAGVVVKELPAVLVSSAEDEDEGSVNAPAEDDATGLLPGTGTTVGLGAIAAVLALLGAGGALLWSGRRRDAMSQEEAGPR